jgi:hypothetical protein
MSQPLGGHSIVRKCKIWILFALRATSMDERLLETGTNLPEGKWIKGFMNQAMRIEQMQSAKTRRYCPLFTSIGVKWSQTRD